MPRVELNIWDRVYLLKVISTVQMTFSSFVAILYCYLITLQSWISSPDLRSDVVMYKWMVLFVSFMDFCQGTLLAVAANSTGIRSKRQIMMWIILQTLLIPTGIFLLLRLYYKIRNSTKSLATDPHFERVNAIQACVFLVQFFFIAYATDFLVLKKEQKKSYNPTIRPRTVYAPTDPQITTTESRYIRLSQSFLFQPSTSKAFPRQEEEEEEDEEKNEVEINDKE